MVIRLDLESAEINAILQVLGDLPSKTGAWPLMIKIKAQAEAQTEREEIEPVEEDQPE